MGSNLRFGRARLTPEEAERVDAIAKEPDPDATARAFQLLLQILRDKPRTRPAEGQ